MMTQLSGPLARCLGYEDLCRGVLVTRTFVIKIPPKTSMTLYTRTQSRIPRPAATPQPRVTLSKWGRFANATDTTAFIQNLRCSTVCIPLTNCAVTPNQAIFQFIPVFFFKSHS